MRGWEHSHKKKKAQKYVGKKKKKGREVAKSQWNSKAPG